MRKNGYDTNDEFKANKGETSSEPEYGACSQMEPNKIEQKADNKFSSAEENNSLPELTMSIEPGRQPSASQRKNLNRVVSHLPGESDSDSERIEEPMAVDSQEETDATQVQKDMQCNGHAEIMQAKSSLEKTLTHLQRVPTQDVSNGGDHPELSEDNIEGSTV